MQVSAKTEYACVAVFELASAFDSGELLQVRRIADAHQIPAKFLVQILLQLKAAGIVQSTRGACGGYRLSRSPSEITVWDIHCVIEGEHDTPDASKKPTAAQLLNSVWSDAAERSRGVLQSTTFAQLLAQAEAQAMYYI